MTRIVTVPLMYEYLAMPSKIIASTWTHEGDTTIARYNINILILQANDIRYGRKVK